MLDVSAAILDNSYGVRITLFGVPFSNESTTNDNSRRWKNWSER